MKCKIDKNEGSVLRRSSRRATIERRVWAVQKKSPKNASIKSDVSQKIKGKKPQNATLQIKNENTSRKPPQGTKRSQSSQDGENAKKKVKKKASINDSDGIKNDVHLLASSKDESSKLSENVDDEEEIDGEDNCSQSIVNTKSLPNYSCDDRTSSVRCRKGGSSEDSEEVSSYTESSVNNDSDRGKEETLLTDDVCLQKVVVEEIVPDYGTSCGGLAEEVEKSSDVFNVKVNADVNTTEFNRLENVLGPTYAKYDLCSVKTLEDQNNCVDDEATQIPEIESVLTTNDTELRESVNQNYELPVSVRHLTDNVDKFHQSVTNVSAIHDNSFGDHCVDKLPKIQNEVEVENSDARITGKLEQEKFLQELENHLTPESESKTESDVSDDECDADEFPCSQDDGVGAALSLECCNATNQEDVEEEGHVSLSVALAQLVDSNLSEAEDAETVTIHPASTDLQPESDSAQIVTVDICSKGIEREKPEKSEVDEGEEGNLVIKEEDGASVGEAAADNDDNHSDDDFFQCREDFEESDTEGSQKENQEPESKEKCDSDVIAQLCHKTESDVKTEKHLDSSQPPKLKKQLPPLIKISSRPPSIKTPLKCPECPMQFCTVRSLLWHFGTHGARASKNCLPSILLQDLIVPWDKPTVSLILSQSPEADCKIAEKLANSAESSSSNSSSDVALKLDSVVKDLPTFQFVRSDENVGGSNGDVILKVPIPRLKAKSQQVKAQQTPAVLKRDKFINILPKITTSDGQSLSLTAQPSSQPPLVSSSSSPTSQLTIQNSQTSNTVDLVPLSPKSQVPKIAFKSVNSTPQVQIQPILSTAPSLQAQPIVTSTKTSSSSPSHIALIPMDKLTTNVGQNPLPSSKGSKTNQIPPLGMLGSSPVPVSTPNSVDGFLEKDGLVMINSNLALRIVSSLPSSLDSVTSTTNSTSAKPVPSQSANNITILPQVDGGKLVNSTVRESTKNPDILTIVPQMDMSKKVSMLKNASSTPNPQSQSIATKSATSPSQVVKLFLLQPKDQNSNGSPLKLNVSPESTNKFSRIEVPLPLFNNKQEDVNLEDIKSRESEDADKAEDDNDDEGMIIDDEKGDDELMDPLSLCAVTMDEENLEAMSAANLVSRDSDNPNDGLNDNPLKVTVKLRGKFSNQQVDLAKYEARKYVCGFCERRFGWSTDLKRHVILHTGEKPFQCKLCPIAFTRKFLLQNHMKRMHPDKCKMSDLWP